MCSMVNQVSRRSNELVEARKVSITDLALESNVCLHQ